MSVSELRWAYDNNPLVILALVFLLSPFFAFLRRSCRTLLQAVLVFLFLAIILLSWVSTVHQISIVISCTRACPEIRHLSGALLRPESEGMRELVRVVRLRSTPASHDTVLLLPEDPNVEAWFDRERPGLSSAIIFVDQYWDRYVEQDFAELKRNPPRIIVIGPRNSWRWFFHQWHAQRGAERLIDLVQRELLPRTYDLAKQQPIVYAGRKYFMDVYVRREEVTPTKAAQVTADLP